MSQIYFWNKTLLVSDGSSVHHQEFFTVHSLRAVSETVWHIPFLCVRWKTPDDGQRNCPKHVEFYSKNKFEKLVHLVGFFFCNYVFWGFSQLCKTFNHQYSNVVWETGRRIGSFNLQEDKWMKLYCSVKIIHLSSFPDEVAVIKSRKMISYPKVRHPIV